MEQLDQEAAKEVRHKSRNETLLEQLGVAPDKFADPNLPNGYFSHSQYVAYKSCAKSYEFRYVNRQPSGKTHQMVKGVSVHSGIEYMLLAKRANKHLSVAEGEAVVAKMFEDEAKGIEKWEEGITADKEKEAALSLFRVFAAHALPKINPVFIEKGFAMRFGDVPMIGWIDLVDEQPAILVPGMSPELLDSVPKKRVTVDFKTGRAKWSENDLRLDTQLTMYAVVEGTPDVRVDQLIGLKNGPVYVRGESVRTPQDADVFIEDVNEVADMIKKGIFPKTSIDSWKCNEKHCAYWSQCRGKKRA
jgi:hypothetical protein